MELKLCERIGVFFWYIISGSPERAFFTYKDCFLGYTYIKDLSDQDAVPALGGNGLRHVLSKFKVDLQNLNNSFKR